jgi:hypothetical protein
VLLAAAPLTARQALYSSLSGSSSALLGLAVAGVAILAAFGLRPLVGHPSQRELRPARARVIIARSLLAASFFLLVLAIAATIGLAVDVQHTANTSVTTLIEASGIASVIGLLIGGAVAPDSRSSLSNDRVARDLAGKPMAGLTPASTGTRSGSRAPPTRLSGYATRTRRAAAEPAGRPGVRRGRPGGHHSQ